MPLRIVIDARRIEDFGIGTYIRNLIQGLGCVDRENEYVLVSLKEDEKDLAGLPPNFKTVVCHRADTDRLDHVAFYFFLKSLSFDLVHMPLNAVPFLMPRPYVVTIHDMSSLLYGQHSRLEKNFRAYMFRRGLLRAERVIAVSDATRHDVITVMGVPPERITKIYDAPDPKLMRKPPIPGAAGPHVDVSQHRIILERYQINYPFILYAGTIRPQKNIPRLVEAFAVLRGKLESHPVYKDLRLIIIGDEISKYPSVRRAVIQTRVENVVRFLGFVPFETLRVLFESAAAFVFPSLYEGFGLPPLEAMAAGTPVVASNVSSLPEVVGNAAILVNPENVFEIASGIRDALCNEDLRRALIARGYEQASRFSWEKTARQVLDTYRAAAVAHKF